MQHIKGDYMYMRIIQKGVLQASETYLYMLKTKLSRIRHRTANGVRRRTLYSDEEQDALHIIKNAGIAPEIHRLSPRNQTLDFSPASLRHHPIQSPLPSLWMPPLNFHGLGKIEAPNLLQISRSTRRSF